MTAQCFLDSFGQGVIPETAPFMVWGDKVAMNWDEDLGRLCDCAILSLSNEVMLSNSNDYDVTTVIYQLR